MKDKLRQALGSQVENKASLEQYNHIIPTQVLLNMILRSLDIAPYNYTLERALFLHTLVPNPESL